MKKSTFFISVLLLSCLQIIAQNADSVLSVLSADYPTEKLYIHYDKEYYVAGETVWFKVYLYSNGKPSGRSSNIYLQFLDSTGTVISYKKYPVLGAVAKGNIDIPDSLPQGNYMIRAITSGMQHEEESMIYKKNLFVFHPASSNQVNIRNKIQTVSLTFFPESGPLVDGVITVIGFKATDQSESRLK